MYTRSERAATRLEIFRVQPHDNTLQRVIRRVFRVIRKHADLGRFRCFWNIRIVGMTRKRNSQKWTGVSSFTAHPRSLVETNQKKKADYESPVMRQKFVWFLLSPRMELGSSLERTGDFGN